MKTRTDLVTAVQKTLEVLKSGEPYTLNKLSRDTKLNFRTIKKILTVLESSQSSFSGKVLDVSVLDKLTVIRMKEKTGLALYPQDIQNLIIKTAHYPTVSREEEILVYLLLKNAKSSSSGITLTEDQILKELVEAEHVAKTTDGRYYLTADGQFIAIGALKLYPELKNVSLNSDSNVKQVRVGKQLMLLATPMAPNTHLIKKKIILMKETR